MEYLIILFCLLSITISVIALVKIFTGKIIHQSNSEIGSQSFVIDQKGYYSIWVSGRIFTVPALNERNVIVVDKSDQKKNAIKSYFNARVNGFGKGRSLLKYYYLDDETYQLKISNEEEDSLGFLTKLVFKNSLFPRTTNFTYELRKSYPEFLFPFILLGIVLPIVPLILLIEKLAG